MIFLSKDFNRMKRETQILYISNCIIQVNYDIDLNEDLRNKKVLVDEDDFLINSEQLFHINEFFDEQK